MESFLDSLTFPTLSYSQFSLLEAPVTLKELEDALASMPKGKSPGLDGIPPRITFCSVAFDWSYCFLTLLTFL